MSASLLTQGGFSPLEDLRPTDFVFIFSRFGITARRPSMGLWSRLEMARARILRDASRSPKSLAGSDSEKWTGVSYSSSFLVNVHVLLSSVDP